MAWFAAAIPYITAATSVVAGVRASQMQKQAGIIQQQELKAEAAGEADAARGREIERRRALLRALSTQNATAGAGGVTTDGSVGMLARRDIEDASSDLLTDANNSAQRIRMLGLRGENARRVGSAQAATTLLDTASNVAGRKW